MSIDWFILLKAFISGLSTGVVICIPLGPSGIESIKQTVSRGFINGFKVSLGAITADMSYLLIINLGLAKLFTSNPKAEGVFWIVSGILLILLNILTSDSKKHKKRFFNFSNLSLPPFLLGFIITFINPMTLSIWLALSGTVVALWRDVGVIYYIIFLISILSAMITWFGILNLLASKGFKMLTSKTSGKEGLTSRILKYILIALGAGFVLFGLIKIIL